MTTELTAKEILKINDLRHTNCREEILTLFLNKSYALAHGDIEENIDETFDRVTVYRTLKTFVEKGIIHKVLDDSGNIKYAFQKENADEEHHQHIHFKCNVCGLTNCFENIEVPSLSLPPGYKLMETNLLVQGVCKVCNKEVS